MTRRSPRFVCPLLWLGYDEIDEGLLPCFSVDEALVLAQTCKSMFIFTLRSLFIAAQKQMKGLVLQSQKIITCDFLQLDHPGCVQLKSHIQESENCSIEVITLLGKVIKKHNLYYKYPYSKVLSKSLFSDVCRVKELHRETTEMIVASKDTFSEVESLQRKWLANDRKFLEPNQ